MKTLILTIFLLLPLVSIADVPCHTAIEIQDSTIKQLQNQLKTAQSVPYNQGYQEGYKVAKGEQWKPEQYIEVYGTCLVITVVVAFIAMFIYAMFSAHY